MRRARAAALVTVRAKTCTGEGLLGCRTSTVASPGRVAAPGGSAAASLFLGLLTGHHVPLGHVEWRGVAICVGGVFKQDRVVVLWLSTQEGLDTHSGPGWPAQGPRAWPLPPSSSTLAQVARCLPGPWCHRTSPQHLGPRAGGQELGQRENSLPTWVSHNRRHAATCGPPPGT